MDAEETTTASGRPIVSRSNTTLFLIRTFVKIGGFHRLSLFEDGTLPTTDEHQIFTWKDSTLREVLTTLRTSAPHIVEYRHPLARFSFKTVYADSGNKGRFVQKDLGMVYSRDILGEPGTLNTTAPRLLEDADGEVRELTEREKEERTLDELRFVPGDYLLISVILPKTVTMPSEIGAGKAGGHHPSGIGGIGAGIGGGGGGGEKNGWKKGDVGGSWGHSAGGGPGGGAPGGAPGRGGGHWRGESNAPPPAPRGRGGRGGSGVGDRRMPPPRRNGSPPARGGGWGDRRGGRAERGERRESRSRSRSRSPVPRRRGPRYD
ncbi:hypothetical protein M378DRAFT_130205 [Amanita muscaria Koide BX008]|uniref:Sin3-associated polypeptide Sap18 n=1 Tax=Amanita muscaria (strain Koide BX008) TaxID=946122 RepID=A0A0C2SDA7_AMAMK|nr:hypothetical protein M378DRAFT_130205 [Amanita muscaria Koide BX008]